MTEGVAPQARERDEARNPERLVFVVREWRFNKSRGLHAVETVVPVWVALGTCLALLVVVRLLGVIL
jgi:hypothetical protein